MGKGGSGIGNPVLEGEIKRACDLYTRHGDELAEDMALQKLLTVYREAILNTRAEMERDGIAEECGICASEGEGSCCSIEAEGWYDYLLLLLNLLMGVGLPENREVPGHCLFVGKRGCKLMARYSFGINYLCPRLKVRLGTECGRAFLSKAGDEIVRGWEVERFVLAWLERHGEKRHRDCSQEGI